MQALHSRTLQPEVELKDQKSKSLIRMWLKCRKNAVKNLGKNKYFTGLALNSIAYGIALYFALITNGLSFTLLSIFESVLFILRNQLDTRSNSWVKNSSLNQWHCLSLISETTVFKLKISRWFFYTSVAVNQDHYLPYYYWHIFYNKYILCYRQHSYNQTCKNNNNILPMASRRNKRTPVFCEKV